MAQEQRLQLLDVYFGRGFLRLLGTPDLLLLEGDALRELRVVLFAQLLGLVLDVEGDGHVGRLPVEHRLLPGLLRLTLELQLLHERLQNFWRHLLLLLLLVRLQELDYLGRVRKFLAQKTLLHLQVALEQQPHVLLLLQGLQLLLVQFDGQVRAVLLHFPLDHVLVVEEDLL